MEQGVPSPDDVDAPPNPPAVAAAQQPGQLVGGRYRLERLLASGGMASVWEAVDEVLTRRVAVKVLHPHLAADDQFVHRFRREAVAAAGLTHPSIVSIYDTCSEGGLEAIVMELVRGPTLRAELDRRGRFEPLDAIAVVAEVADALRVAHEAGIVHRDVKPGNILLSADGRVLVTDFGIAQASDGLELTGAGMTLGTAKYLSPEQVEGRPVDARADVYAAGVVLYELVCGQAPFVADTELGTALARVQRDPAPPRQVRPDVPPNLESIILRALAREPADRFQHATELRDALRAAARWTSGQAAAAPASVAPAPPVAAPPPPPPPAGGPDATHAIVRPADHTMATGIPAAAPAPPAAASAHVSPAQPSRRRRRWGLGLTFLLVLGAIGTAIALWLQAGDPRPPRDPFTRDDGEATVAIASVTTFDPPPGDGDENGDAAAQALDGDAATAWRSECYSNPEFGGIPKVGVGLVLTLDGDAAIGALRIEGGPAGWSGQVHVADEAAPELDGWGEPVATVESAGDGPTDVDLGGATGTHVLVLFTALPDAPTDGCPGGTPFAISVSELAIGED